MKKFNVTYEQVASYSNIYAAYLDARKGKSERNEIMRFSLELDAHLNDLYNDLQEERYKVSGYRIIYIHVPKKRLIMALQFRDRVLQCDTVRRRLYYFTRQQEGTMAGIGESRNFPA